VRVEVHAQHVRGVRAHEAQELPRARPPARIAQGKGPRRSSPPPHAPRMRCSKPGCAQRQHHTLPKTNPPQAVKPSCAAPCCSCMLRALRRRQQQPEPKPYPMGSSAGRALGCRMRARRTSRGSRPAAAPRRPPCGTCQRRCRTCAAHGRAEHAGMGPAGRTCDSGVRPAQPAQALRAGQTQRHLETAWRMQGFRILPCTPAHEQRRRADAARRRLVGQRLEDARWGTGHQTDKVATQEHTEPHMSSTDVTAKPASSAYGRTPPAHGATAYRD